MARTKFNARYLMEQTIEVMRQSVHETRNLKRFTELGLLRRLGSGPAVRYEVRSQ
jgi:hypothetical protein